MTDRLMIYPQNFNYFYTKLCSLLHSIKQFCRLGKADLELIKLMLKGYNMYHFSAPMPYNIEDIDRLLDINNQVEKSKITSLYACVPRGCEVFTGFEQSRNFAFDNANWEYWKKLIEHALNKDCDFIYLLNSPRPLDTENSDFSKQLEKLELLLTELRKMGVKKLRVASGQLMSYIGKHYYDFNILASTSLEYKTIWEYQNFIAFHPEVKQIVPSHDINKNFKFLSNLITRYPKTEIELMVNEGCLQGCPNRMLHEYINIDRQKMVNDDICLSGCYATSFCHNVIEKYPIQSLVIGNLIFPWEIDVYKKIGIKKFKLVGRDGYDKNFQGYLDAFFMYLKGIDNIKYIENFPLSSFSHHLQQVPILKEITIKDYKKYLPDIKHFIKNGHLCASRCAVECRYCYRCADKIQKVYEKKMKEKEKMPHFIPACTIT